MNACHVRRILRSSVPQRQHRCIVASDVLRPTPRETAPQRGFALHVCRCACGSRPADRRDDVWTPSRGGDAGSSVPLSLTPVKG